MKLGQSFDTLMSQAFELIEVGNPKAALEIGKQLEEMCYSGTFEIQAMAYAEMGEKRKAVEILEKGVKIVPDIWQLWQLLGNYESGLGHYDKAISAFENSLKAKNPDTVSLYYNYAIALQRHGKADAAMNKLQLAFEDQQFNQSKVKLIELCFSLLMNLHNQQQNYNAVKQTFEQFSKAYPSSNAHSHGLSEIYSELAFALWKTMNKEEAIRIALQAIHLDKQNRNAQFLLREIRKSDYQNAKYMRIILHGWHKPFKCEKETSGFFITYDVMADDEKEALAFIKEFEPEQIRNRLQIEEIEILKSEKQPKGIYKVSDYYFYSEKS